MEDFFKLVMENPITAGAIGTAIAAVIAFFKPIMRALQRALIRRIEAQWPDGKDGRKTRESVVPTGASEQEAIESIAAHVRDNDWMTRTLPAIVVRNGVKKKQDSDRPPPKK